MKIIKTASGKTTVKISRKDWENFGKKAGWYGPGDISQEDYDDDDWEIDQGLLDESIMKNISLLLEDLSSYGVDAKVEKSPETKEWDLFINNNLITTSFDLEDIFARVKQIGREYGI